LAFSVIIPVSVMIYSNSRVGDLRTSIDRQLTGLDKQIADLKSHLDKKIDTAFEHMELLLKLHEAEHHKK